MRIVLSFTALLTSIAIFIGVNSIDKGYRQGNEIESSESALNIGRESAGSDGENDKNNNFENTDIPDEYGLQIDDEEVTASSNAVGSDKKNKPVIVIDAGHGGYDVGSIGPSGSYEKNNTLSVALKLGSILQRKDIKVFYTRKSDKVVWPDNTRLDLLTRARISNDVNADLFLSIHNNSSSYKSIRGTETYFSEGSSKGRAIASTIQREIVSRVKTKDRGIKSEDFSIFRNVSAPTVLVELGYISNEAEENMLKSSSYQQKFAEAIGDAVLKYISNMQNPR